MGEYGEDSRLKEPAFEFVEEDENKVFNLEVRHKIGTNLSRQHIQGKLITSWKAFCPSKGPSYIQ